ncbi:MAG: (d)CMP kinase [Ruminococcus sp.]|nr:(d)CMP kinase [Ruminococcus sp.]
MPIAIAIDGPAGAGKSTIAKLAAKELNFIYVDTGALYRTVGLAATKNNVEPKTSVQVDELLSKIKVELTFNHKNEQIVLLDGEDVSSQIRTPEASMMASAISAVPAVRAYLLDLQRNIAKTNNVIMDGRDIGTVVLPDAQIKIFLSADPEDRAKRRYDELVEKGMDVKYEDILADVIERDYNDSHREIAPLKPAEDSIMVNTTGNTLEQSVELLIGIMKENM